MALPAFRRGAAFGAVALLGVEALVVVAVAVALVATAADDPPDPSATRRQAAGTVTQTAPRLCVEDQRGASGDEVPRSWCGLAEHGLASSVAVGEAVVGSIVEVELDPGSGPAWSFWESLMLSAD